MAHKLVDMKSITVFLFLVINLNVCAQNEKMWLKVPLSQSVDDKKPRDIINVVDESNGNFASFVKYSGYLEANLFDKDQNLISNLIFNDLPKYSDNFLGCSKTNNSYTLYFKNTSSRKFSALTFNFDTLEFSSNDNIGIKFKKESFIESFEANNQVFFLTSIRNTSILNMYNLKPDGSFTVKAIDLSKERFLKYNGMETHLHTVIQGMQMPVDTFSISAGEPSSLELASAKNKIYFRDGTITITFNTFDNYTGIITIDIKDASYTYDTIDNKNFEKTERGSKTNSFIYGNYFFNMYVTRDRLVYDIYELDGKTLVKTLHIERDQSISFKNSPIILEGGDFTNYRELDRTAQFLRKLSNSTVSTFAYEQDGKFIITIGCSESFENGTVFFIYGGAGLVGALVAGAANALLTSAFQSYTHTKSTRIECLFDSQFNHIDGDIPLNGFDRIQNYIDQNDLAKAPLQSVFKLDGRYVFGYLDKISSSYIYIQI